MARREEIVQRDAAPATIAAVLPLARRIADALAGTKAELETLRGASGT